MLDQQAPYERTGFCRVTRRRPCRICGKPDWCSYTRDERLSICMRVREGARKLNRHGGAIHCHEDWDSQTGTLISSPNRAATCPSLPRVPLAVRDLVYQTLLELSPAANYRQIRQALLARGFPATLLTQYGLLPATRRARERLVCELIERLQPQLPTPAALLGVPGFWANKRGVHLWRRCDDPAPRLVIPVRDPWGRIQACQLRAMESRATGLRYCWLSSAGWPNGTSSGSPLHHAFPTPQAPLDQPLWLVEGVLKANLLRVFCPMRYAVAAAGVTVAHEGLLACAQGQRIVIAYDQDYRTNEAVGLAIGALLAGRLKREGTLRTTQLAVWREEAKGIDDALQLRLSIGLLDSETWFQRLSGDFQHKLLLAHPSLHSIV